MKLRLFSDIIVWQVGMNLPIAGDLEWVGLTLLKEKIRQEKN